LLNGFPLRLSRNRQRVLPAEPRRRVVRGGPHPCEDAKTVLVVQHRPLGREQRILERAEERVAPGEVGSGLRQAAAELLLDRG
jgi:hypothetical protein